MPFLALLTRDGEVERAIRRPLEDAHVVARAGSWERLGHLVRERPVTAAILDEDGLPAVGGAAGALADLRARFPSLPVVLVARPDTDPFALLRLGRAGLDQLLLIRVDDLDHEVPETVARGLRYAPEALVTRAVSPYLPARVLKAVRLAMEGVQRRWSAPALARKVGLTQPHLSVCLKAAGLPSAGHLLIWARLLHAARWLPDPGRSAESVSRQLDYSSGAAFRRMLRNYADATPTQVIEAGGFPFLLDRFVARCGLGEARADRSVA